MNAMKLAPKTQRLAVVTMLLLWCTLLITLRMEHTGNHYFTFLWWNLLLAFIPLMASSAMESAHRKRRRILAAVAFLVWLAFLPNAPYILTDLMHLHPREDVALWFDLSVLMSCAGTGLYLGYISLLDVQLLIERRFGQLTGWSVAIGSLMMSGFGIYIGRFLRWNSWELVTQPFRLLSVIGELLMDHGDHPNPYVVTLVFGIALTLGYAAFRVLGVTPASEK